MQTGRWGHSLKQQRPDEAVSPQQLFLQLSSQLLPGTANNSGGKTDTGHAVATSSHFVFFPGSAQYSV